jgi:hypothetical protein
MEDFEAQAFAAWCLQDCPRKARFLANKNKKTASFECLVKHQEALVAAFRSNCPRIECTVWHSRQYPIYPSIDRVTVDFAWTPGTLRVDPFTIV